MATYASHNKTLSVGVSSSLSLSNKALSAGTPGHFDGSVVISATVVIGSGPVVFIPAVLQELGFLEPGLWVVVVDINDDS